MRRSVFFAAAAATLTLALVSLPSCGDSPAQANAREGPAARGLSIFMATGCATCHSEGSIQGPYLERIGDEYLAAAGGDLARAKRMVVAYLKDPKGVGPQKPREGKFLEMPAYHLMSPEQLDLLAEYVLSIRDGRKP